MRAVRKTILSIVCLALVLLPVTGCFQTSADELYSLPQSSKEYLKLQQQLNAVLNTGAVYSPPMTGTNRQSVQLKDIDGDGVNEAIAFFRTNGEKPLKIYIFKQKNGDFYTADVIEGDGTAFESIRYADMDGDGTMELIVGWQMSTALMQMSIYSMKGGVHSQLATADYSELTMYDINGDGHPDVLALRLPSSELPGEAESFSLAADGEVLTSTARLSKGLQSISRIQTGGLTNSAPAIFVDGAYNGGKTITDIIAWFGGGLTNITAIMSGGVSKGTIRDKDFATIYATDINKDGVMEVPSPRALLSGSDAKYYVIDWYAYAPSGEKKFVFTTYHDFSDGWYLVLPDTWKDVVTVRREDSVPGERTMIFSYAGGRDQTPIDFLKIYTLAGDNKSERASLGGRFILTEHGDNIYCAEILSDALPYLSGFTVDRSTVTGNFKLIYSDWVT